MRSWAKSARKGHGALRAALVVAGMGALAAGCSTNTVSVPKQLTAPVTLDSRKSASFPTYVVIRYPSKISNRAYGPLREALLATQLGSSGFETADGGKDTSPDAVTDIKDPARQLVLRSAYFSLVLYKQLRDRLPAGKVALQPAEIDLNDQGHLYLKAGNELSPAILNVDAYAYVGPSRMKPSTPETFGEYVTPVISVYTARDGSPQTAGAMIGLAGIRPQTGGGLPGLEHGYRGSLLTFLNAWRVSTRKAGAFASVPGNGTVANLPRGNKRPATVNSYFETPLVEYKQDRDLIGQTAPDPAQAIFAAYANLILEALNAINGPQAVRYDLAQYAKKFDTQLGAKLENGAKLSPAELQQLDYVIKTIAAEQQVSKQIGDQLYDKLYAGSFGGSIRAMMKKEAEFRADYKIKTTRKVVSFVLGMAAAGLAGYAGSQGADPALTQQTMLAAQSSIDSAGNVDQSMQELAQAFNQNFIQSSVVTYIAKVEVRGQVVEVRGARLAEIREKFQEIYWKTYGKR